MIKNINAIKNNKIAPLFESTENLKTNMIVEKCRNICNCKNKSRIMFIFKNYFV